MIVTIWLTEDSLSKIDKFAKTKDISRSSAIRYAINSCVETISS